MSPSQNNNNTMHPTALDLIRELDSAMADMNAQLLQGAKDAETARHNAHMAAELARRFSSNNPEAWNPEPSVDRVPQITTTPLQPPPPPTPMSNGHHRAAPSPPRFTELQNKRLMTSSNYLTEELLQANLDLDKVSQQLENEKMSHDETKAELKTIMAKNKQLEQQLHDLMEKLEEERNQNYRQLEEKTNEIELLKQDLRLANEDADFAVQITKEKEEERATWESYVEKLVIRNDELKAILSSQSPTASTISTPSLLMHPATHHSESKPKRVYFADETDSRPSRSLVAAGRQLLQRKLAEDDSPLTVSNIEITERRQQLQKHLQQLSSHNTTFDDELPDFRRHAGTAARSLGSAVAALDVCRNTAQTLKESGARLNLSSRWFKSSDATLKDEMHLETLAKQYTSLVEIQLNVKHKEIQELESLCKLWEEGIGDSSSKE